MNLKGGMLVRKMQLCPLGAPSVASHCRQLAFAPSPCSAMALRLLAAVLLGAAAWQCAFVTSGAGPTRSPQVSMRAAAGQSQATEQENGLSPVVSIGIGAIVGLLVAAAPALAVSAQGYEQMGSDDVKRYEKPEGTSNLLKELTGDKKKFYAGKEDLDYRSKGYKMEEYKTERELQAKLKGGK